MKPLRYVILGAGGISHAHVNEYARQSDVTPVGFLDIAGFRPVLEDARYRRLENPPS